MFAAYGFARALEEITLVLFTTLAPSGAVAFMIMAVYVLALRRRRADEALVRRIEAFLVAPVVVTMVGLIASATHLGNPANALYVFSGVGRSPLSNEVVGACAFLGIAGVYWLYSFSLKPRTAFHKVWLAVAVLSGAAFVTAVGFAYRAETIQSWNTPFTPISIWGNALAGGPLLAMTVLAWAKRPVFAERAGRLLSGLSVAGSLASTAAYLANLSALSGMSNGLADPLALDPYYGVQIAVFAACSLVAGGAFLRASVLRRALPRSAAVGFVALAFAGIFVMRFAFYMTHLTV